jgi:hypothetical protein
VPPALGLVAGVAVATLAEEAAAQVRDAASAGLVHRGRLGRHQSRCRRVWRR